MIKFKNLRKSMVVALVVVMLVTGNAIPAFAEESSVAVTGEAETTVLTMTVPGAFSFTQDSAGNTITATNLEIVNNTLKGYAQVTNISFTQYGDWAVWPYSADVTNFSVDMHVFTMQVNMVDMYDAYNGVPDLKPEYWAPIAPNGGKLKINYTINLGPIKTALPASTQTGGVIFTFTLI